jgi:hypothetical protein
MVLRKGEWREQEILQIEENLRNVSYRSVAFI